MFANIARISWGGDKIEAQWIIYHLLNRRIAESHIQKFWFSKSAFFTTILDIPYVGNLKPILRNTTYLFANKIDREERDTNSN